MSKRSIKDGSYVALTKCFVCGKSKDLLVNTRLRDISEIHNKVVDREPCEECKVLMQKGIILISVRDNPETMENGNLDNPYRTGGWWVFTQEACERMFKGIDFTKNRLLFIENKVCKACQFPDVEKLVD